MCKTAVKPPAGMVEASFRRLAAAWHRETDYLSSMGEADSNPAYPEIVRLA